MRYSEFLRGIADDKVTVFPFKPAIDDARSTGVVIDEHTGYQVQFSKDLPDGCPEELREAMEGSVIVVYDHKTPDNGPAYIWLSSVDRVLLKCYEAIILQHAERTGQEYRLDGPFFVTSTMSR